MTLTKTKNSYTEDSIQKMDPLSFTRHRPDSYLGSNEDSTQLLREIVSNCTDEFLIGHCTTVHISYDPDDNVITVTDDGQGILPNVFKDDGRSVLEMVYGDINTSGKYDRSEDAVYKISTGAFGIGASLTNFLSHFLEATTCRDGQYEKVHFSEGVFKWRATGTCDKKHHGVTVRFQPNEEFFQDARINVGKVKQELFNLACVCQGIKFTFNGEEIYHPNGIVDIADEKLGTSDELCNSKFSFAAQGSDVQKLDFCMAVADRTSSEIVPFCNYGLIESGTPVTAVKTAITKVLNSWAREQGMLKPKEKNIDGTLLQEGMVVVFNLVSQNIRYDSQTKVRVVSTDDNQFITDALSSNLIKWLDNNPNDGKAIIDKALLARRAAEAAKKARDAIKNGKKKDKVFKLPTKLIDAWSKNRKECEFILVEGDSAASPLAAARNGEFQGIFPLRGKLINCYKQSHDRLLANQEINNIIQALGLEYNKSTKRLDFDENKLRYGKIITACDGDADGLEIENLIFTFFWCFCPELIKKGYIYSAIPPLFRVTTKKNEYVYLKDSNALEEYKQNNKSKIKFISRNKG